MATMIQPLQHKASSVGLINLRIMEVVEHSLPKEDKANWDPRSEFQGYELIETFLDVKGMTQAELAKDMDLSPAKINDIIKGRRKITPKTAKQFAKVFGVGHTPLA